MVYKSLKSPVASETQQHRETQAAVKNVRRAERLKGRIRNQIKDQKDRKHTSNNVNELKR